jgi:hypothetical protein
MNAMYKEATKGINTEAVLRAFLAHGLSNKEPQTKAGRACKNFLTIVESDPRLGELLIVPSIMDGRPITLDELVVQPVQLIVEVTGVHGSTAELRFVGALQDKILHSKVRTGSRMRSRQQ